MRTLAKIWRYLKCRYCGKSISSVGSGMNMGTEDRPMCERCYENGGDDQYIHKVLTIIVLLCFSINSFGQVRETGTFFYGTNNKVGFELNAITKSNLTYGFGLTFDLERKNVGGEILKDHYDAFPSPAIKNRVLYDLGSLYGTFGYSDRYCNLGIKLGVAARGWYNYLENGNYFTTNGGIPFLYGVYINPHLNRGLTPYVGYDNFNGFNFGITIRFN